MVVDKDNPFDASHLDLLGGLGFEFKVREMGLLDEAISEFQKVVMSTKTNKTEIHANLLNSCHILALCFMEKGIAPVAVKWYIRALKIPQLDSETIMALQYDLGNAYEYASDFQAALENFTEVYSQNIDYRDVSERIQSLQLKKGL